MIRGLFLARRKSKPKNSSKRKPQPKATADKKRSNLPWLLACVVGLLLAAWGLSTFQQGVKDQAAKLEERCVALNRLGNWEQLELVAREWAVLEPTRFEPWLYAATAAEELGIPEQAAGYLKQLPPDSPLEAFLRLGSVQLEVLNQPFEALATLRKTLGTYPDDPETHRRLMFLTAVTCQRDELRKEVARAKENGSDIGTSYAYEVGSYWLEFSNGYRLNRLWLESAPENETLQVAAAIQLGTDAAIEEIAQDQSSGSLSGREFHLRKLEELLLDYPDNLELVAEYLYEMCTEGNVEEIERLLDEHTGAEKKDPRFYRYQGWLKSANGELEQAAEAYEKAIESWPLDWLSRIELAAIYRQLNQPEKAAALQGIAGLGKELQRDIMLSGGMERLGRNDFRKLAEFYRLCGLQDSSEKLLEHSEGYSDRPSAKPQEDAIPQTAPENVR